jgi:hypothetical protein
MSFPTTPGSRRRARTRNMKALLATIAVALSSYPATVDAQGKQDASKAHPSENEAISVKGGYVEFHHYGEIIEVSDEVLDGRGMRAYITVQGGAKGVLSDFTADDDPERLNLSIPEGRWVILRLCYTIDHADDECSRSQVGYA